MQKLIKKSFFDLDKTYSNEKCQEILITHNLDLNNIFQNISNCVH